jgi:hypothetical protein
MVKLVLHRVYKTSKNDGILQHENDKCYENTLPPTYDIGISSNATAAFAASATCSASEA